MALSIKDEETDRLARALSAATGETLTEAIRRAVQERLERETARIRRRIGIDVRLIQERLARLPVCDPRPADAILGYDDHGVPT
jgi:antitoxin VapB